MVSGGILISYAGDWKTALLRAFVHSGVFSFAVNMGMRNVVRLTKDAIMGGTARLLKYSVCPKIARIVLRPQKAPMKPHTQTSHVGGVGCAFARYPSQ